MGHDLTSIHAPEISSPAALPLHMDPHLMFDQIPLPLPPHNQEPPSIGSGQESSDSQHGKIILLLQRLNSRLDSMESRLTTFKKHLQQIKGQIIIPCNSHQSLFQSHQTQKTYSIVKEFVEAPNILLKEADTFKRLKIISKSISDI
ncbi:hypothetical protein L873DRAFT_233976 [Choiromyces venosus 120613-1]|uniref:Uncharacterized protein n=1 Tax=Choiromyces venosus 120613-1 TaxID=1336337 RepID=A0A3N4JZ83_9PEZI|nr:hypothetical protein L873DRAFT_233976 [Choiromyces venosus 120613-1]